MDRTLNELASTTEVADGKRSAAFGEGQIRPHSAHYHPRGDLPLQLDVEVPLSLMPNSDTAWWHGCPAEVQGSIHRLVDWIVTLLRLMIGQINVLQMGAFSFVNVPYEKQHS